MRECPFEYSALLGRFGLPAVALATVGWLAVVAVVWPRLGPGPLAGMVVVALLSLRILTRWLTGPGPLALRAGRTDGVNVEATPQTPPRLWLVAHVDSKSQRYPPALRVLGVLCTVSAWAAAAVLVGLRFRGVGSETPHWPVVLGVIGAALLALGGSGDASPGAADNASGVAAVLEAAARLGPDLPVGVLVTDAEEVGLAGAHAWARGRQPGVAINCDTIDDRGAFRLMPHGRDSPFAVGGSARAAAAAAVPLGVRRLPAGILTDGVALARAGWASATLSRVTFGTLLRIHTPRDSVEHLTGAGIAPAAALLEALVRELLR